MQVNMKRIRLVFNPEHYYGRAWDIIKYQVVVVMFKLKMLFV